MRMSQLLLRTLRETPAEAELVSHQLLLRGCFIRPLASGIFSYLPLGTRVKQKVEEIIREEMDAIGGQEIIMPMVHPAAIWQESGRWYDVGPEMARFKDRGGQDMVLGMTHEEVVTDIVRNMLRSYRQLPLMLYQIQTKFRDEPRSRGGLIRVREFTMKDAYSFHTGHDDLDAYYEEVYQAYYNIYDRCGLNAITVESDTGMMGGTLAHEYMYLTPVGEDTLIICQECSYRANKQIAATTKPKPEPEDPLPTQEVYTPDCKTIAELAKFLGVPESRTAKAVFITATVDDRERFVFAVLRGDMELNETKLANAIKATKLVPATEAEIRAAGAEPGFGSPVGLGKEAVVVVDDLIPDSPNLVGGANKVGYHLLNVNYGRDYTADVVTDITSVGEGDPCPECGAPLTVSRGIEVGNIFKLGDKYSKSMKATYLDEAGKEQFPIMGCYGIGSGRLIASVIEEHHDENGIIWPISIAPYHVHLMSVGTLTGEIVEMAEGVYGELGGAGIEVLYDDRDERAGVKFNDADLIGVPLRLMVGAKGVEGGFVELKLRSSGEVRQIPREELLPAVREVMEKLKNELLARPRAYGD